MRMSINTTSGWYWAACAIASRPLPASATTTMSGSSARSMRRPARTIEWSSTTRVLIATGSPLVQGQPRAQGEAPILGPAGRHLTTVDVDPLADADQSVAEAVGGRRAVAIIANLEVELRH